MISTIETTPQQSPELLQDSIDSRLTKLRPMSTPVDQISRFTTPRPVNSMKVGYYAVAMRDFQNEIATTTNRKDLTSPEQEITINVKNPSVFEISETIIIEGVLDNEGNPTVFYVTDVDRTGTNITVRALNPAFDEEKNTAYFPRIERSTKITRMGRAAAELDVQTGQYETLPTKMENYCQIFKSQIEQSTLLTRVNKEVGWTLSDQEEVAIYDMKLGMERSFLFGTKALITDPAKKCEVYFTGGIWAQAGKEVTYSPAKQMENEDWISIMAKAFTGHNGSKRKILIAGTGLIERISTLVSGTKKVIFPDTKVTLWGMDFTEMITKFGTLYVIHSEVLDSCGHADDGLIIDPEYLTKYVHTPFKAETLDLRTSGQRNTEAVVMTEISCLVLRYPAAHCRVICKTDAD